jgi:twitching motility two-component system response regulator PilG
MIPNQYKAQQLTNLFSELQSDQFSGSLHLKAEINLEGKKRFRVLVWKNGRIVYGGLNVPSNQEFAKMLGQKLNRHWIDTAIKLAMEKATTKTSIRELLELLVSMRLFTWEQIETIVHTQIVLTVEQVLPYAGQFKFDSTAEFNICRGLEFSKLMLDLTRRQEQWSAFAPLIPSMEAVPHLQANTLQTITDPTVFRHLHEWVDGQRSLVDIAEELDKDPLSLAQSYVDWVQAGWVAINDKLIVI